LHVGAERLYLFYALDDSVGRLYFLVGGVRPRHSEEGGARIDRDPAKMTILSEVQALDQTVGGLVIGDPNIIGFGTSF
jgi:hypothetical protein